MFFQTCCAKTVLVSCRATFNAYRIQITKPKIIFLRHIYIFRDAHTYIRNENNSLVEVSISLPE